jgi:hypothetical protein
MLPLSTAMMVPGPAMEKVMVVSVLTAAFTNETSFTSVVIVV